MLQVVGSERVILSDSGSILTITEAILSDVGLYTCNASNDHGTAEADDHRLLMVYCECGHQLGLPVMTNSLPCLDWRYPYISIIFLSSSQNSFSCTHTIEIIIINILNNEALEQPVLRLQLN